MESKGYEIILRYKDGKVYVARQPVNEKIVGRELDDIFGKLESIF
jgi:hypothetical protein